MAGGVRAQGVRRINSEPKGWLAPSLPSQEDVSESADTQRSAQGWLLDRFSGDTPPHARTPVGPSSDALQEHNMEQE